MTVEEYLRSLVPGVDLQDFVLQRAARSPIEVDLDRLDLDEDEEDYDGDEDFQKRLDYASSTIYYSVGGVFSGSYSEQVGDVRASKTNQITKEDRAYFRSKGDEIREKWGWKVDSDDSSSEMYDATYLRR